jgi:D-aminopeptidase
VAFGWKGGIGTSSRRIPQGPASTDAWTVGVLVQSNYGGKLVIDGVPVWKELTPRPARAPQFPNFQISKFPNPADGSCMIVVATDAPLDAKGLQRLAARAIFALARTGSTFSNGSGDFAIAFSTHRSQRVTGGAAPPTRTVIPTDGISALFEAALDATEEAVDNSLLKATDVTANGRTVPAIPIDLLRSVMKKYGRVTP